MIRKKYIAIGFVELSIVVPMGGAYVRVELTGGQQSSANGLIPASFTTTNAALQDAIERSPRFRQGVITVDEVETIAEKVIVQQEAEEDLPEGGKEYPEVTNIQKAKSVLMDDYGVALADLQNRDAIKNKAEELNVSFPNWR